MIQYPPLPPAADINYVIHQLSPFVGLILMFVGVRWVLRSTGIGEAFAERVDFAERLLAKQRDGERLAPPRS